MAAKNARRHKKDARTWAGRWLLFVAFGFFVAVPWFRFLASRAFNPAYNCGPDWLLPRRELVQQLDGHLAREAGLGIVLDRLEVVAGGGGEDEFVIVRRASGESGVEHAGVTLGRDLRVFLAGDDQHGSAVLCGKPGRVGGEIGLQEFADVARVKRAGPAVRRRAPCRWS